MDAIQKALADAKTAAEKADQHHARLVRVSRLSDASTHLVHKGGQQGNIAAIRAFLDSAAVYLRPEDAEQLRLAVLAAVRAIVHRRALQAGVDMPGSAVVASMTINGQPYECCDPRDAEVFLDGDPWRRMRGE